LIGSEQMKFFIVDQYDRLQRHLDILKTYEVMPYNKKDLTEKTTTINLNTSKKLRELDLNFMFDYQIFPAYIMRVKTQWGDENRPMKVGDTIVQQVYLPPTKIWSQKIIFGVRINEVIDEVGRIGFSYETLTGHAEKGISFFTIEQQEETLVFNIKTDSTPGSMLSKIMGPFFTVPYQTFCTQAALNNIKKYVERQ
jgi:uncharacterized protein (UPF0548 family)